MLVWLIFVLACLSLCLSCMELSTFPVLVWLFPFPCKGSFWLIISSSTFSFCFSTYAGTPIIQTSMCLKLSQRSLKLSSISFLSYFFFLFILFLNSGFHHSCFSGPSSALLPQLFCYWFFLMYFPCQLFYFSSLLILSFSWSLLIISCFFLICSSILIQISWIIFTIRAVCFSDRLPSSSFNCFYSFFIFLLCLQCIFCLLILSNLPCFWSPSCRVQDRNYFYFPCLPPG